MDRRTLLSGAAVTAPGLALLMSGGALGAAQDGDRLSPRLVTGIENGVQALHGLDDTEGSSNNLDWAHGPVNTLMCSVIRAMPIWLIRCMHSEGMRLIGDVA